MPGTAAERRWSNDGEPISVVVVDDHDGFRTGLAAILAARGLDVVGQAPDGETAIRLVAQLAPDVMLMDLGMPGLGGVEATRRIAVQAPSTAVLVLTISAEEDDVFDAMLAGASGYLLKGVTPEVLVSCIEAAARRDLTISAPIASKLFARLSANGRGPVTGDSATPLPAGDSVTPLSARELEILRLIASGKQNTDIANELVLSPYTVRNHVSNLLKKLQLQNRTQAAAYAMRQRLL